MCSTLTQELQEAIKELTFGTSVPSIDLGDIVDSMAWSQEFRRQGYSFIEHGKNQEHTGVGYRYLLERAKAGRNKGMGKGGWKLLRKGKASQKTEWVDAQVKKYLTKERQFLQKLIVCMHVLGKQLGSDLEK